MKARKHISNGIAFLMIGSIIILPSCGLMDWLKDTFGGKKTAAPTEMPGSPAATNDGSAVLATMGGSPLITKNMLEAEKRKLIESNPQMEAMIALMDENQLNRNLVDGMASREIIRKYVVDKGIQGSDKYQKDLEMAVNQMKDLLNTRYFMEDFKSDVSDKEVQAFYDENKDSIPNLLLSRGGIESTGVSFENDKAAQDFMAKVKEAKNNIAAAAKALNLADKVKNFNLVNAESIGIEPELREKIVAIKTTPSLHKFTVGKEVWVVAATRKEAPKYRELASVKDEIRQLLEKDKTMKVVEEEVAKLKDQYDVKLVENQFAAQADSAQAVQAATMQAKAEAAAKTETAKETKAATVA